MFGPDQRTQFVSDFQSESFDLCIIGGGITGAGIARDAAMRGMSVALIEANDFAFGTSSRSSKLIHGGIRYLENLEFGLVYEALTERRNLFSMAPHLVHPLRFVLPLYEGGRVGMFKMGLGMWLYDILALFEMPELHERLSAKETEVRVPDLKSKDLLGSYVYSDAYMDDDRLTIETIRSAVEHGAKCVNYVKATGAKLEKGQVRAVQCRDQISGEEFFINARHVVSCVGPWTDLVGKDLLKNWNSIMRPSKGIHLTFERERLPLNEAVVMATDGEKRIVFGIPRHEMVIVGTTDTDYQGDPGDVATSDDDVEYVLRVVDEYFPGAKLQKSDIVASYAGVRPLVHDNSKTESGTSREHLILSDERNVTFVTGGKYTTYRHMAEETIERVLQSFPIEEQVEYRACKTKTPLNDKVTLDNWPKAFEQVKMWSEKYQLNEEEVDQLVGRHGWEAEVILEKGQQFEERSFWQLEARHAVQETLCLNLIDFFLRRTPLFLSRQDHGLPHIDEIAQVFTQELGWSEDEARQQKEQISAHIKAEMSWKV